MARAPWIVLAFAGAGLAHADEPAESWWAWRTGEVPCGSVQVVRTPLDGGGTRTTETLSAAPYREGSERPFRSVRTVEEGAGGVITRFAIEAESPDSRFAAEAVIEAERCTRTIRAADKAPEVKILPWPAGILGPVGVEKLRREKGFVPGTRYTYLALDLGPLDAVSFEVFVEGEETSPAMPGAAAARLAVRPLAPVGPPLLEWWRDGRCLRRWDEAEGATSRVAGTPDEARRRGAGVQASYAMTPVVKAAAGSVAPGRPSDVTEAVFRLRLASGEWGDPAWDGGDQDAKRATDGTVVVKVTAGRPPGAASLPVPAPKDGPGTLAASYYCEVADEGLIAFATGAVAGEKNAAKAAAKLSAAVGARLRKTGLNPGMATAAETLRQGEGDALEHAVLFCALARIVGLPSRVAGGLLYRRGDFVYHAWPEAYCGRWMAFDPMRAGGEADAARVRLGITDLAEGTPEVALIMVGYLSARLSVEWMEARQGALRFAPGVEIPKTAGGAFDDPAFGVRLTAPPGWSFTDKAVGIEGGITVCSAARGRRINVRAGPDAIHKTPDDVLRDVLATYIAEDLRHFTVDGRPAVVADLKPRAGAGFAPRMAIVLDGGTVFAIEYQGDLPESRAAFDTILERWRFTAARGKGGRR